MTSFLLINIKEKMTKFQISLTVDVGEYLQQGFRIFSNESLRKGDKYWMCLSLLFGMLFWSTKTAKIKKLFTSIASFLQKEIES